MTHLDTYQAFIEARLSDVLKLDIKRPSEFSDRLQKEKDRIFQIERDLVKFITLDRRINNKRMRFRISYNDNAQHSLMKRIENRTQFKSVQEFNDILTKGIKEIFPESINTLITQTGKYGIRFNEYNFSVVFFFDMRNYLKTINEIKIVTVLPSLEIIETIFDFDISE